jgi:hypothetical protein
MIIIKTAIGIISISIALIILYVIGKATRPLIDPSADAEEHIVLTWLRGLLGIAMVAFIAMMIVMCWAIGEYIMQSIM